MKLIAWLVALASALFLIGGIGTISAFVAHADGIRPYFMWTFLAGLIPTMIFLVFSLGIAVYHFYLTRIEGREITGWFTSDKAPDKGK